MFKKINAERDRGAVSIKTFLILLGIVLLAWLFPLKGCEGGNMIQTTNDTIRVIIQGQDNE